MIWVSARLCFCFYNVLEYSNKMWYYIYMSYSTVMEI